MKGKTLILKNSGDNSHDLEYFSTTRNARGKKDSWCKAEAKRAARTIRRNNKINLNEVDDN